MMIPRVQNKNWLYLALVLVVLSIAPTAAWEEDLVAHSASVMTDPVYSPDGKKLAWIEGDKLMLREGGSPAKTLVSGSGELRSPSFAGDGKAVFFCARKTGNFDLMRIDLDGGKTTAVTTTPEDEFQVVCSRDRFTKDYDAPATATYFKLLFLRGKDGSGTLCESRDDGSDVVARESPTATHFSVGNEMACAVFTASDGLRIADWVSLYESRMVAFDGPGKAVLATGGAGLVDAIVAADGRHYFARRGEETVVGLLGSTTIRPFISGIVARVAVDPAGRQLAYVKKSGGEFQLIQTAVPEWELGVVNGYKWLGSDLSRRNVDRRLPLEAYGKIATQRFVVTPDSLKQFCFLYEGNRYSWAESYITTDAVLFLFHQFYDSTLKTIERGTFRQGMFEIAAIMAEEARKASVAAKKPKAKELFLRWWGFFSVASSLREDTLDAVLGLVKKLPPAVREAAQEDVNRVFKADSSASSAVLGRTVDFSQFKVRGHYEGSPALSTYFRMMMWFSQVPLKVFEPQSQKPSSDLEMILSLFYLGQKAKIDGKSVLQRLEQLNSPLEYLVGETEDIGVVELQKYLKEKINLTGPESVIDEAQINAGFSALSGCAKPKIRPQEDVQVMFFPQRFTLDSYAMQRLVYKAVGTPDKMRLLPNMLDVMAALGSSRAEEILLNVLDEGRYKNYKESLAAVKKEFAAVSQQQWESNVYRGWLRTLGDVVASNTASLPVFARSAAWADRMLNSALGSLTTLRHDTLLYNKQGAAEAGEGGEEYMIREYPGVLVDPYPEVFSRLRRMTLELYSRMSTQGFLPPGERDGNEENAYDDILSLNAKGITLRMIKVLGMLEEASKKQIAGQPLNPQERLDLFEFGRVLEHLTLALLKDSDESANIINEDLALVADVFTGDGNCLEMAIGRVFALWVRHDAGDGDKIYRGGVFSYFEFPQPVSNRLTDKEWRGMIRKNKIPKQPAWVSSFVVGNPACVNEAQEFDPDSEPGSDSDQKGE